jgi:hypothetical protein
MTLSHCRSCEAPIIWTVTASGKRMPVDADPLIAPRGFRLEDLDGETITAVFTLAPAPGEQLYLSHFATCPHSAQHRRTA